MTTLLYILAGLLCVLGIAATFLGKMYLDQEPANTARAGIAGVVAVAVGLFSLWLIRFVAEGFPSMALVPAAICVSGTYIGIRAAIMHARVEQ